jgi:hypothetical protein
LASTNRWLTAADAYVARYPTKLAFCSRFRRQRETPVNITEGVFLWLLGITFLPAYARKNAPPHKAQKGRR